MPVRFLTDAVREQLELADQLLLVGVHRHHRHPSIPKLARLLVEVAELRVPVRMLAALGCLGVGLEAVASIWTRSAPRLASWTPAERATSRLRRRGWLLRDGPAGRHSAQGPPCTPVTVRVRKGPR